MMGNATRRNALLVFLYLLVTRADGHFIDSTRSEARRWYIPSYVPVQFAGNIGFFSTGVGYTSKHQSYHLDILYGYVPKAEAGAYIHTLAAKNYFPVGTYVLNRYQALIPYFGLGVSLEVGGNSFFRMPSHFPDSYYDFPKNIHVLAYGGVRLRQLFHRDIKWLRGTEFYVEAGTIDVYIWYKAISSEIKFHEIFSLALGVNFLLHRDNP